MNLLKKYPSYVFIFCFYSFSKVCDSKHNNLRLIRIKIPMAVLKKWNKVGRLIFFLFSEAHFLTLIEHIELNCV